MALSTAARRLPAFAVVAAAHALALPGCSPSPARTQVVPVRRKV